MVPAHMRKPSNVQFIANVRKLRKDVTVLLLRDFGIKDRIRDIKYLPDRTQNDINRIVSESASQCPTIEESQTDNRSNSGINVSVKKVHEVFPKWFLDYSRTNIMNILSDLQKNVIVANGIFIDSEETLNQRRKHLDLAIANCEQFLQEFEYIIDVFDNQIDVNKLLRYVDLIVKEIKLLKGVRRADRKTFNRKDKTSNKTKQNHSKILCMSDTIQGMLDSTDEADTDKTSELSDIDMEFLNSLDNIDLKESV